MEQIEQPISRAIENITQPCWFSLQQSWDLHFWRALIQKQARECSYASCAALISICFFPLTLNSGNIYKLSLNWEKIFAFFDHTKKSLLGNKFVEKSAKVYL